MTLSRFRQWGGALALVAYAFQLLVSLGHVHADEVFGPPGHGPGIGRLVVASADRSAGSGRQDHADSADGCAICAVTHMAASGFAPPPLAVPVPTTMVAAHFLGGQALSLTRAAYLFSRTRAPPSLSV